ncbi:MAG: transposase [Planctomycetaceae bacterium]|nr:transposase [Planctomycetaceae bacterium]
MSVQVFDPEPLKKIAQELGDELPAIAAGSQSIGFGPATLERLSGLGKKLTAVDGSIVKTLARIAKLSWIKVGDGNPTCGYRLHTQFEILRGIPNRIDATSANPKGQADERVVLEQTLEPDRLYVMDRGYNKEKLWIAIHSKSSGYIYRVRDNFAHQVIKERTLSPADLAEGVVADQLIKPSSETTTLDHAMRLVVVRAEPHTSHGRRAGRKFSNTGPSCSGQIQIVTDQLDIPAELIAEIYRLR